HGIDNAFVTQIDESGNAFVYSTYLGGPQNNSGYRVAVDLAGTAYVAGTTSSLYFPKTLLAFQQKLNVGPDIFVAKIAAQTFVNLSPLTLIQPTKVLDNTSPAKKLLVTNQGSEALSINKIYISGSQAGDFYQSNTCGSSIAVGSNCTVFVTFTPTEKNLRHAVLAISDSDPASPHAVRMN